MVDPTIVPEAVGASLPIVKKMLEGAAPTIQRGAGNIAKHLIDKTVANLQIGFTPYLEASYARCKEVSNDLPV